MKPEKPIKLLFIVLAFVNLNCGDLEMGVEPPSGEVRELTTLEKRLVQASNQFGLNLFRKVSESEAGKNAFISPLSVSMALGMTLNGASGSTKEAMESTLRFTGMGIEQINESYRSMIQLLVKLDPKVQFQIANSIWYRLGFAVEQEFIKTNQQYFDAEVNALNFSAPDAAKTINAWVERRTQGKIKEIVPDPIPGNAVMYLINAIYFLGTWTYQFDKTQTRDAPFTLLNGSQKPCKLMYLKGTVPYFENNRLQAVDLPYGDSLYSMIVVLPKSGTNVENFVAGLTQESWNALITGLRKQTVHIYLPKFTLEYKKNLNDVLKALGMAIAFDPGRANFTKIHKNGGIFISNVEHKTFVRVDEEGTEAAAVTSIGFVDTSVPQEFVMRVDRSFFFAIRERHSGTILFMGKILDPPS